MDFGANNTTVEIIKGAAFGGTYFETFILVLVLSGPESRGKNLMSSEILIRSIIIQIIVMLVLIDLVLMWNIITIGLIL